jgi:hypothetical protein
MLRSLLVPSKDQKLGTEDWARTKVVMMHDLSRYKASIKVIPTHYSYLWGLKCPWYLPFAVERWKILNEGITPLLYHVCFGVFDKIFKKKSLTHCTPQMVFSYHSSGFCMSLTRASGLSFSYQLWAYMGLKGRKKWGISMSCMLLS